MSNQLVPTNTFFPVPNKADPFILGNQSAIVMGSLMKPGISNFNLLSEMGMAAIRPDTKQLMKEVANLQSPLSPSSYSSSSGRTIEERLFDATSSVKMLTAQVAMHMDKKWRDKLFSQVDSLHDLDEWDTDDKPVKKSSFATFLKAILQIKPKRNPGLGLTHEGYLIAAWTIGHDQLTTEFLPKDRVRWVLSHNINGELERAAGETVVSRLYECLTAYNPDHWFAHEKN
jgi:hypothetical protein